jgi:hypothetical protein
VAWGTYSAWTRGEGEGGGLGASERREGRLVQGRGAEGRCSPISVIGVILGSACLDESVASRR